MSQDSECIGGSFRDPSGFLFRRNGILFRQVNRVYQSNYEKLIESGLYDSLVADDCLVSHEEVDESPAAAENAYKVLQPELIPFISYPYEWCFSELKDAALMTLEIQEHALKKGMSLRDASAYNIQFRKCRPILIDSLSFETYQEGRPWVAYRQFCQHFLAPLALMAYTDVRLSTLLRDYIDGIPLDLARELLPARTKLRFGLLSHIHLHAKAQGHYAGKEKRTQDRKMSKRALQNLLHNLKATVAGLEWKPRGTEWGDYYEDTNYSDEALKHKTDIVKAFLEQVQPKTVWDIGANIGYFSELAASQGANTIAFDIDPAAVEKNYRSRRQNGQGKILPLLLDLTNPSPALGWAHQERASFMSRGPTDTIMALGLIHHIAISNNVPFVTIFDFFSKIAPTLIMEFIPKEDSQVQRLLATRDDIFPNYTQSFFENSLASHYRIVQTQAIQGSKRIIYYLQRLN